MTERQRPTAEDAYSRRNFLAVGGVGIMGISLRDARAAAKSNSRAVIQILMNGGASQLDTFDPKPNAPREIRGPVRPIATSIPGVHFAESLPKLAQRASDLVVLRSLYHESAPNHESGLQLLLSGSVVKRGLQAPNIGIAISHLLGETSKTPTAVRLGGTIRSTGMHAYHGNQAGLLSAVIPAESRELSTPESLLNAGYTVPDYASSSIQTKRAYGETRFGVLLWTAARLVEAGCHYLEINTFDHMAGAVTWDAHGCPETAPGTLFDYRDQLVPQYDRAVSALFDDLQATGLWSQTLIVSTGEMGRTPRINDRNGRDHWPQAWSGFLAGGGLDGGQVIGATDATGEAIQDHPIHVSEIPGLIGTYLLGERSGTIQVNDELSWSLPNVKSILG